MKQVKKNVKGSPPKLINNDSSKTSSEVEQQFEVELYWCINQLQQALANGKLNPKQTQEHTKAVNILMSKTATIIRKRQVMRLSFGDYRSSMAKEEKKLAKFLATEKIKLTSPAPNTKSVFVKKATGNALNSNFKFNFDDAIMKDVNEDVTAVTETEIKNENIASNYKFVPSSSSFKFNFDVEDCDQIS